MCDVGGPLRGLQLSQQIMELESPSFLGALW